MSRASSQTLSTRLSDHVLGQGPTRAMNSKPHRRASHSHIPAALSPQQSWSATATRRRSSVGPSSAAPAAPPLIPRSRARHRSRASGIDAEKRMYRVESSTATSRTNHSGSVHPSYNDPRPHVRHDDDQDDDDQDISTIPTTCTAPSRPPRPPSHSPADVAALARQVVNGYASLANDSPVCTQLVRRTERLVSTLDDATHAVRFTSSAFLWVDDVHEALKRALVLLPKVDAARAKRERKRPRVSQTRSSQVTMTRSSSLDSRAAKPSPTTAFSGSLTNITSRNASPVSLPHLPTSLGSSAQNTHGSRLSAPHPPPKAQPSRSNSNEFVHRHGFGTGKKATSSRLRLLLARCTMGAVETGSTIRQYAQVKHSSLSSTLQTSHDMELRRLSQVVGEWLAAFGNIHRPDSDLSAAYRADLGMNEEPHAVRSARNSYGFERNPPTMPLSDRLDTFGSYDGRSFSRMSEDFDSADANAAAALSTIPKLPDQYVPIQSETVRTVTNHVCGYGDDFSSRRGRSSRVVAIHGPTGVGKSVIASAVAMDPEVGAYFPSGIAWIQLAPSLKDTDFVQYVARAVATLADDSVLLESLMETCEDMKCLEAAARDLGVNAAPGLVVVDNALGSKDLERLEAVLSVFGITGSDDAGTSGPRVLLTTSDDDIADHLSNRRDLPAIVPVTALPPLSDDAVAVFSAWASMPTDSSGAVAPRRASCNRIIQACGGLPLALAMAGAALRRSKYELSAAVAAFDASRNGGALVACDGTSAVEVILRWLVQELGAPLVRRLAVLSVLPAGVWVPSSMLACLWRVDSGKARMIAGALEHLALSSTHTPKHYEQGLRLHPQVHQFCTQLLTESKGVDPARPSIDKRAIHQRLLAEYASRRGVQGTIGSSQCREWWLIEDDAYIYRFLSWHLVQAGLRDELGDLLCEYRWIRRRVGIGGVSGLLNDYDELLSVGGHLADRPSVEMIRNAARALRSGAASDTEIATSLCMNLASHGTLLALDNSPENKLLDSVARDAPRPWFRPIDPQGVHEMSVRPLEDWTRHGKSVSNVVTSDSATEPVGITVGDDGSVIVWQAGAGLRNVFVSTPRDLSGRARGGHATAAAVTTRGRYAIGNSDGSVVSWSLRGDASVAGANAHEGSVTAIAVGDIQPPGAGQMPSQTIIASGSSTGSVVVNDYYGRWQGKQLPGYSDEVVAICILPRQRCVVTGSFDGFAMIYNIDTDERASLNGHRDFVTHFCSVDDGRKVASCCNSGQVYVWCSSRGICLWTREAGVELSSSVALSRFVEFNYLQRGDSVMAEDPYASQASLPYFCTPGDDPRELVVVSALGGQVVMGNCMFDAPVSSFGELWIADSSTTGSLIALVGLQTGHVYALELVTCLASQRSRSSSMRSIDTMC